MPSSQRSSGKGKQKSGGGGSSRSGDRHRYYYADPPDPAGTEPEDLGDGTIDPRCLDASQQQGHHYYSAAEEYMTPEGPYTGGGANQDFNTHHASSSAPAPYTSDLYSDNTVETSGPSQDSSFYQNSTAGQYYSVSQEQADLAGQRVGS